MKYVISDIHGCIKTFEALLKMISFSSSDELYLLGDYIDRGPNSKAVLDLVIALSKQNYNVKCLKGNHEDILIKSRNSLTSHDYWIKKNGGRKTLESFEKDYAHEIPKKYFQFVEQMQHYFIVDDFILVHGGLNFKIENPFDNLDDMLWTRNNSHEIDLSKTNNKRLIVGHTPLSIDIIGNSLESNLIRLDGGCVYHDFDKSLGKLVAFEMESREIVYITNCETSGSSQYQ